MSIPSGDGGGKFSRSAGGEKRVRALPAIRISETLEYALLRLAAIDDRTLSGYVARVLERHVFGHVASLEVDPDSGNEGRALQRGTTGFSELSDR